MSNTLLPCPFCGREALMEARYVKDINDAAIIAHYVRKCHHCGATFARSFPSMKEADAAWNRRAGNDTNVPTNADRIRSMSDEELAEYIFDLGNGSEYCYGHCAYQDDCATKGLDHDTCIKGVIDWLKQPVKEE